MMIRPSWKERCFPGWMFRLPRHLSNHVAVTFDDGPHSETTPALLHALDRAGIPSTHFIVGEKAATQTSLLSEISSRGHLLANHGYHHESFLWKSGKSQTVSIARATEVLQEHADHFAKYFRPPYGQFNLMTGSVLDHIDYRGVLWSLAIADWKTASAQELWRRLHTRLHERAVILLHDARPSTPVISELLLRLADEISRRGWKFSTLPFPLTVSAS